MAKQKIIFFLGIWVAILPFLGFPGSWKQIFFLITGLLLAYLGYMLNKQAFGAHADTQGKKAIYTENKPFAEKEMHEDL